MPPASRATQYKSISTHLSLIFGFDITPRPRELCSQYCCQYGFRFFCKIGDKPWISISGVGGLEVGPLILTLIKGGGDDTHYVSTFLFFYTNLIPVSTLQPSTNNVEFIVPLYLRSLGASSF